MTSESAFPAQEAVVATDVLRFRGGRRPFLTKKRLGANNNARDGAEENERENHDWWSQRVTQVRDWLRSNPLHLGLDDMAVKTLQQMLREGDSLHVNDARKLKCWLHICIELGDVPGSPLHHDDKIDSEIKARARLKDGHRVSLLAPGSPETCEDEDLAQPTIPTIGAEARLRLEEVEASSGRGNNATPSPRHAATQTEPGREADDTTTERKKIPLLRQRSVSRMEELASCTSALLDACKLDLMNRANAETRFAAGENEAKDQGNSGASSEGAADAAAHEASMIPSAREERKYRFANNSTADKGKVQVQDHADFQLDSFYRKRDRGSAKPGVSLLMGRREDDLTEQVVAVIFDRARFEEADADDWMHRNIHRFPVGRRELIDKARNEAKT
ncbi:Hypothetical Protein FCC1311_075972 [Hondaea fermentalgiana]|uniref:Uncharacterized protein n=1 Tax=Hondaea fermentalgiana TaxID=2315210 RepID=A0A2R5GRV3_9STRA|nr:Hypothetical Protein FCC1311_075972 [Hondaea fermentalgiana]|eukprot:GBG31373.1 Hypothetical Protein FCC1311_075972 [Hondaea fermentalgiana]